jgi:GDP-mannose 4,6-dehydratase
MRALITGITGMVGSHLADYLLKETDWDIYGMHRWRSPSNNIRHLIERINNKDRVFLVEGDLCDQLSVDRCVKETLPDYVFHLAAQSYPSTSFTSPLHTLDVNILGTTRLLEAIRNNASIDPVVHVCSSSEVYGRVPKEKLPIRESCSIHPASPYAISKVGTDLLGKFYAEAYGVKTVISRMFTHSGPRRGDVFVESSFAKQIILIEAGLAPSVIKVGNLDSLRTWMDVRDAVRAYYLLVTVDPIPGESYNIGGSYSCDIRTMLSYLLMASNLAGKVKIEVDKSRLRPLDADLQIPDTSKFKEHTGWEPSIPFKQTMADLLAYWRTEIRNNGVYLTR